MEDDSGFHRGIVEPSVQDGEPRLDRGARLSFEALTADTLNRIVDDVNAWYDARD